MGIDKEKNLPAAAELRRQAEERWSAKTARLQSPRNEQETQRLIHELEVHQIELEMQGEAFRQARDEAEAALEKYADLYDFAPVGYFTLDHEGIIRSVNLTGASFLGVERSRLLGRRFGFFVTDEARSFFSDFLGKVFTNPAKEACDVELLKEGNSPLFVRIEGVTAASGQECRIALFDITERKRGEEDLRESEERLRLLIDGAKDYAIFLLDADGRVTSWNEGAKRLKGWDAQEILGRHFSLFYTKEAVVAGQPEHELEIAAAEGRYTEEGWRVHKDGSKFMAEVMINAIRDESGKLRGFSKITRNITERKQAEEAVRESEAKYRELIENASSIIRKMDREGKISFFNDYAQKFFGYSLDEALGQNVKILIPSTETHSGHSLEEMADIILSNPDAFMDNINENVLKNGKRVWISWRNKAIRDASGDIVGNLAIGQDITERKRTEASLRDDLAALTQIHALSARVLNAEGIQPLLQDVMDAAVAIMRADYGTLQLIENDSLRIVAHHGHQQPFLNFFAEAENKASVCGEAMQSGGRVVVPDVETSPLFAGTPSLAVLRDAGVRAVQSTPIVRRTGGLLGILTTQWSVPSSPENHDFLRIDLLARQAADLIEHSQAEQALRESEEQFRALADSIPNLAWWANGEGYITWYNRRWYEYTGTTPEQMEGWGWQSVHDQGELPKVLERWQASIATGEPFDMTFPLRGADGVFRPFLTRVIPLKDAAGRALQWFGTNTDVSELKRVELALRENEEQLALALRSAGMGVWRLDLSEQNRHFDDQVCRCLGIDPARFGGTVDEFYDVVHPDDLDSIKDALYRTIECGAPYEIEYRVVWPDRRIRHISARGRLARDAAGQPQRVDGLVWDITERKQAEEKLRKSAAELQAANTKLLDSRRAALNLMEDAVESRKEMERINEALEHEIAERKLVEEELKQAKEEAEAATRAKSQFLANMSHELRTPMTGVIGMLDVVLSEKLEADQRECVEIARTSARSLVRLLNDILDVTKLEMGKFSLEENPFSIRQCIQNTINILIPVVISKGIRLKFAVEDNVPEMLVGDQTRLNQVMTNLAGNAVKFTEKGTVELRVTAGDGSTGGKRHVTFAIADTGIGIPDDKKDLLFQVFSQVDESHSRSYGGSGLGLSISKEIVERMGGTISFTSEVGKGSIFTCTIPFGETEFMTEAVRTPVETETVVSLPAAEEMRKPRLLIAEDDPVIRQLLGMLLQRSNYDIDTAETGLKAVEMWEYGKYDLILMDVQMPILNGFEATGAIRAKELDRGGHIPIIAMTAHALKEDEEMCLAAGMDAYISKPIDFKKSLQVIGDILKLKA